MPLQAHADVDETTGHGAPRRMRGDKRRLIMLAYLRDRSRHDLSIRLGIPANTVKTHLRRALLELRATMFASIETRTRSAA